MKQKTPTWTFEDLYNILMETIEPDLCTYNIGLADSIYEGESAEERGERYAHYGRALDQFRAAFEALVALTKADIKDFEKAFFSALKKRVEKSEQEGMSGLEKSISAA